MKFRLTRNRPYPLGTLGYSDVTARQGYYVTALSEKAALAEMEEMFPGEVSDGFTVQVWEE